MLSTNAEYFQIPMQIYVLIDTGINILMTCVPMCIEFSHLFFFLILFFDKL